MPNFTPERIAELLTKLRARYVDAVAGGNSATFIDLDDLESLLSAAERVGEVEAENAVLRQRLLDAEHALNVADAELETHR